LDKFDAFKT
jgi:hypothetical protein